MYAKIAVLAAILCFSTAMSAQSQQQQQQRQRLNEHVAAFDGVQIEAHQTMWKGRYTRENYFHQGPFAFTVNAYNSEFRFDLEPHTDLHAPDLKVMVYDGQGGTEVTLDDRKYYRGHVNHNISNRCHFRVGQDGSLHGYFTHDGEKYSVDPADYHFAEPQEFNHVVYRLSDHDYIQQPPPKPARCGVQHVAPTFSASDSTSSVDDDKQRLDRVMRKRREPFQRGRTVCDVGVVADSKFFSSIGGSNIGRTIDIMTARFANVEEVYEEDNDIKEPSTNMKIGITLGYLEVQKDTNNDPYNPSNMNFNQDGSEFLQYFSTNPNEETSGIRWDKYCLVHLLTNQEFSEGLLGLAWVGSEGETPGGICQNGTTISGQFRYTNTGFSTQTNYEKRVPDTTVYLVFAHEMGHNFGSDHDEQRQEGDGQYLMWPVSVDGSQDNNYHFSPRSMGMIGSVISAKGGCFIASESAQCGNSVQEEDEPCDCGSDETLCPQFDSCCAVGCVLADNAQCSPQNRQNGTCCTDSCQKITDTSMVCREDSECMLKAYCTAEGGCPPSDNRPNNTVCENNSGLCNKGSCSRSVCHLWGLEEVPSSSLTDGNPCLVYCDPSNPRTTDQLGSPAITGKNKDGSDFMVPDDPIAYPVGTLCLEDDFSGQCDENQECVSVNGEFFFDDIENILKGATLDDIKNWALREDAYIPNYGWLLVGLGALIILIVLCCVISNRMDKASSRVV